MNRWMNGWTNEWRDGQQKDEWTDKWADRQKQMDGRKKDRLAGRHTDRRTDNRLLLFPLGLSNVKVQTQLHNWLPASMRVPIKTVDWMRCFQGLSTFRPTVSSVIDIKWHNSSPSRDVGDHNHSPSPWTEMEHFWKGWAMPFQMVGYSPFLFDFFICRRCLWPVSCVYSCTYYVLVLSFIPADQEISLMYVMNRML